MSSLATLKIVRRAGEVGRKSLQTSRAQKDKFDADEAWPFRQELMHAVATDCRSRFERRFRLPTNYLLSKV